MAIFYPKSVPQKSPYSEIKVRNSLTEIRDLVVFHSVGWQSRRNNRPGDGEADFVILVPNRGILVLEVKGGGVETDRGVWQTTGADGVRHAIKDPFEQAKDSKFALLELFRNTYPQLGRIPLFHGVCFPDITIDAGLSPLGPRELIFDRNDLRRPWESLERIGIHWKASHSFSDEEIDGIVSLLAPTSVIRRVLRDEIADAEVSLIRLTEYQVDILRGMGRNKRSIILGGAGTGKTILAMEKARLASKGGLRTLLVCYNAPLKEYLSKAMRDSGAEVESFHSLVVREMKKAKLKFPESPGHDWFESRAVGDLLDAIDINQTRYDAVIVDEAQDFSAEWMESLLFLTKDAGSLVYLFADSHQDLYSRGWRIPEGFAQFELTVNCRNTDPIAKRVCRIFLDEFSRNLPEGPEPVFIEVTRREQFTRHTVLTLEKLLLREGLSPSQVVVLSDSNRILGELKTMGVGDWLFTDLNGRGIHVETISRFKGLEREIAIIILTNSALEKDFKKLAYVAMSRAKSGLFVLGGIAVRRALSWT